MYYFDHVMCVVGSCGVSSSDAHGFDHVMYIAGCVLLDHVSGSYDVCKNITTPTLQ